MDSLGWECALLGSILFDPSLRDLADIEDVSPGDFTIDGHRILWRTIIEPDKPVDIRTIVEMLRERDLLNEIYDPASPNIIGEAYLAELMSKKGTDVDVYVEKILSASGRRDLQLVAGAIASMAQDMGIPYETAIDQAETKLMSMRRGKKANEGVMLGDILDVFIPRLEKMRAGEFTPAWQPSIAALKQVVMYVEHDEYVIVAARPGDGKSSFLRHEALVNAMSGNPTVIFNLENSHIEYARAMLAMFMRIDNQTLRNPSLVTDEILERVKKASSTLSGLPLHIVTLGSPSVNEILRILRAKISKFDIKLAVIDYAQLISNPGLENNKNSDLTLTSQKLRGAALNFKVPIMVAAQLNREIERRGKNAIPKLADLRDSGSFEQDATQVYFLRKWWGEPTPQQLMQFPENLDADGDLLQLPKVVPMKIFVAKHRNGPVGTTEPIIWNKSLGTFASSTERDIAT